ncbi:MAG TPA: hypothetical protein VL992_18265 [Tepidisphaeraceae bacterium]|nr:hypothetical protein [Tepidisphaeraceae bacterium]
MNADKEPGRFEAALRAPFRLLDWLFVVVFLFAVAHICWSSRRIEWLLLCLLPPLGALAAVRSPNSRPSTKLTAALFLALISLGDVLALFNPSLGQPLPGISTHENVVLQWYIMVYLVYGFAVFPPILFIRPLVDRWRRRPTYFHSFTCYLGLLLWLFMGPGVVFLVLYVLVGRHVR